MRYLTLILLLPILAFAKDTTYGDVTVSRVVSVYDGDTIKVDIDHWHPLIGGVCQQSCRLTLSRSFSKRLVTGIRSLRIEPYLFR